MALSPKGVMRVVWERSRCKANGSTEVDHIPFLSVARSLGDFWSFNPRTEKYAVSPEPDISAIPLNLSVQKFVVIASDGLWNVMTPNDVVSFIHDYQNQDEFHQPKDVVSSLIKEALHRWNSKGLQADNIAVLIAFLSEEDPEDCSSSTGVRGSCSPLKTVADSSPPSCVNTDHLSPPSSDCHLTSHSPSAPPLTEVSTPSEITDPPSSSLLKSDVSRVHSERVGGLTELETKIKLKKRKHRKHRRHGLEKELARYNSLSNVTTMQ